MKTTLFKLAAIAVGVAATPVDPVEMDSSALEKSSAVFRYLRRDVNGVNGDVVDARLSRAGNLDLQELKIRYGPYVIPANDVREKQTASTLGIGREKGGLTNVPTSNIAKPCTDCIITSIGAGLEDDAGNELNVDTGLMLHHMVLMNGGKNRRDATCGRKLVSLPQEAVMATGRSTERFFSSGNERSVANFLSTGHKTGYVVNTGDKFSLLTDLMNMNAQSKKVWVTVTYQWLSKEDAVGFTQVKPIWLDYDNCGTSDVEFPTKLERFKLTAKPWDSDFGANLILGIGHLHDGGTHLDVRLNDKVICDAKMSYGTNAHYVEMYAFREKLKMNMTIMPYAHKRDVETVLVPDSEPQTETREDELPDGGRSGPPRISSPLANKAKIIATNIEDVAGSQAAPELSRRGEQAVEAAADRADPGMYHISAATECKDMGTFKKGDSFVVQGYYDMTKHSVMKNDDGKPKNLMAIAIVWADVPMNFTYKDSDPFIAPLSTIATPFAALAQIPQAGLQTLAKVPQATFNGMTKLGTAAADSFKAINSAAADGFRRLLPFRKAKLASQ